jgi:hypothetical protein
VVNLPEGVVDLGIKIFHRSVMNGDEAEKPAGASFFTLACSR